MKKLIIIGLITLFTTSAFAVTRENVFNKFGPKLIEAIVGVMRDEINDLRKNAGLQEKSEQQIFDAIDNKIKGVSDYEFLKKMK